MVWNCPSCTLENSDDSVVRCDCCGEPRQTLSQEGKSPSADHDDDHYEDKEELKEIKGLTFQEDEPKHKETLVVEDTKMRSNLAVMLKEQGNDFFRKQDFRNAIKFYGNALEHDSANPHLYLNRAACFIKLKEYNETIDACNIALHLTGGKNVKAWFRRGVAYKELKDPFSALYDLRFAQILDPTDSGVKSELTLVSSMITSLTKAANLNNNDDFDSIGKLDEQLTSLVLETSEKLDLSTKTLGRTLTNTQLTGIFSMLRQNQTLKEVDISGQVVNALAANFICQFLASNRTLETLRASNCKLGAEGVNQIANGVKRAAKLSHLYIDGNYCRGFGAEMVRRASANLIELDISRNCIGDLGLSELLSAACSEDSLIKTILSQENGITSDSASSLIQRFSSPIAGKLSTLDLSNNLFSPFQILKDRAVERNITLITTETQQTGNPFLNTAFHRYD